MAKGLGLLGGTFLALSIVVTRIEDSFEWAHALPVPLQSKAGDPEIENSIDPIVISK